MLQSGKPDFPFMYCWANENWSRRWDGDDQKFLIKQEYSDADDIEHIRFLCQKVFSDSRYIRVNGKPFFVVYRPKLFPDIKKTLQTWRKEAHKLGIGELYIGYMQTFNIKEDPEEMGFDVAIDFQPDFYNTPSNYKGTIINRLLDKLKIRSSVYKNHHIINYAEYVRMIKQLPFPVYKKFPSLTPMWDNAARRKEGAFIFKDATPDAYGDWLKYVLKTFKPYSKEENFVFINAWNEWAEGNHLEPCIKWGRSYLEATKRALENE
jgi:lipopolysaccharide biosynthesis protein